MKENSGVDANDAAAMTEEKPKKGAARSKKFRTALRVVIILLILTGLVLWRFSVIAQPADSTVATYSNFTVEDGEGMAEVAKKLADEGFVDNAPDFELVARLSGAGEFRTGTYYLSPSMDAVSIIRTLTSGLTTTKGFSIPAGYTVEQIAEALDRDGLADRDKFIEAASSPDLAGIEIISEGLDEHPDISGTGLTEGFLLPAEYTLDADADESMMVIMMIDAFSNFYTDDYRARADEMGVDVRDILCIAAVIETETSVDSERAMISSVLHNRYNLELASPEEIYTVPLCNPSRESIIAALYPEETEYTHYVLSSKLDGTHVFTSDDAEYEAMLAEYNAAAEEKQQARAAKKADADAGAGSQTEQETETEQEAETEQESAEGSDAR